MIHQIKQVAGIALATGISGIFVLGFAAEAKAFNFSVNLGSHFLNAGDSVTLPPQTIGATGTLTDISASLDYIDSDGSWAADLLIQIDDGNGNSINIGGFNTTADVDWEQGSITDSSGSYTLTTPAFSSALASDGTSAWTFTIQNDYGSSGGVEYNNLALDLELSATPVPFGVSSNMGIAILGGLYGASRLRKKLASKLANR